MSTNRKSFVLHIDSLDILDDLEDEQVAKLFRAIKAFQNDEEVELDAITKMVFLPFKNQFTRDNEKYAETCKRRAEAGSKGGKAKVANASKSKQTVANQANLADSDSKNKSDSKSNNKNKRFIKPSVQELNSYFLEKGIKNTLEAEKMFNYYESNGWQVGRNKMKDWKAAARNWISKLNPTAVNQPSQPRMFTQ